MSAFFDTNILIYAFSRLDVRQARALELLGAGGEISVQVMNEFVSVARRKLKMTWPEVRDSLSAIETTCVVVRPLTPLTHRTAVAISERDHLNIYDALIVASAQEGGCDVLWSEDMQDGRRIGDLTICNPFKTIDS